MPCRVVLSARDQSPPPLRSWLELQRRAVELTIVDHVIAKLYMHMSRVMEALLDWSG